MSKIKPDTYLPLFGVETEYPPTVTYYLSRMFPAYNGDVAVSRWDGVHAEAVQRPHGEDSAPTDWGLLAVEILDIIPPSNIPVQEQAQAAFSLLEVAVRETRVDVEADDVAAATFGLQGVTILGTLVLGTESAAATFGLQSVEIL